MEVCVQHAVKLCPKKRSKLVQKCQKVMSSRLRSAARREREGHMCIEHSKQCSRKKNKRRARDIIFRPSTRRSGRADTSGCDARRSMLRHETPRSCIHATPRCPPRWCDAARGSCSRTFARPCQRWHARVGTGYHEHCPQRSSTRSSSFRRRRPQLFCRDRVSHAWRTATSVVLSSESDSTRTPRCLPAPECLPETFVASARTTKVARTARTTTS